MKKIFIIPVLLFSLGIVSCKKDVPVINDEQQSTSLTGKGNVVELFSSCADWSITLFQQEGINKTNTYHGVLFKFCPGNALTIFNDILAFNGNWYFMLDKGNPQALTIDFDFHGTTSDWAELEGTWKIIQADETSIRLQNIEGTSLLTFQRNK